MQTSILSPTIACISLTSTQLIDDCMDQLTRTRWQFISVSVSEHIDVSRSLLWHISYSCILYLLQIIHSLSVEYNENNSFDYFLSSLLSFSQFARFVRIVVSYIICGGFTTFLHMDQIGVSIRE
jgi:hypothetical protein